MCIPYDKTFNVVSFFFYLDLELWPTFEKTLIWVLFSDGCRPVSVVVFWQLLFLISCNFFTFHRNKFLSFMLMKFKYILQSSFKGWRKFALANFFMVKYGFLGKIMVLCSMTLCSKVKHVCMYMVKGCWWNETFLFHWALFIWRYEMYLLYMYDISICVFHKFNRKESVQFNDINFTLNVYYFKGVQYIECESDFKRLDF